MMSDSGEGIIMGSPIILDGSVIVRSSSDIYYALPNAGFKFNKLTSLPDKTTVVSDLHRLEKMVRYHEVPLNRFIDMDISTGIVLAIQAKDTFWRKLMTITEFADPNHMIRVENYESDQRISHGLGVTMSFFEKSLKEYSNQYIIQHNYLTSLNLDELSQCNDAQLYIMGKMFVLSINNMDNHLPIRLPLLLICAIKRCLPTTEELEYFAFREDREAYVALKQIENDTAALQEAGFDTYEEALHSICKLDLGDDNSFEISRKIANGFLLHSHISNLKTMNLPTLDYYLSGEYGLNSQQFLSKIVFDRDVERYRELISSKIRTFTNKQLTTLLVNWSGTSVLSNTDKYRVSFGDPNSKVMVIFSTCARTLTLHPNIFRELDVDIIVDLLTSECEMLVN